jgi:peptidoglycan/LPS O-acetylase OafA/YrhL
LGILQFAGLFVNDLFADSQGFWSVIKLGSFRFGSICSVLFFYLAFTKADKIFPKLSNNAYINFIDKESFAIYLFHSPLMYIVLFSLADTTINPILLILINFMICILGSILISKLIWKTKKLNFILGKS